jgi:hypothetical protein
MTAKELNRKNREFWEGRSAEEPTTETSATRDKSSSKFPLRVVCSATRRTHDQATLPVTHDAAHPLLSTNWKGLSRPARLGEQPWQ